MSRSVLQPSEQKLAEQLTILNDWVVGMVTRLYNIKKAGEGNGNPLQYSWLGNLTNKGALSMGSQKSRTALSD